MEKYLILIDKLKKYRIKLEEKKQELESKDEKIKQKYKDNEAILNIIIERIEELKKILEVNANYDTLKKEIKFKFFKFIKKYKLEIILLISLVILFSILFEPLVTLFGAIFAGMITYSFYEKELANLNGCLKADVKETEEELKTLEVAKNESLTSKKQLKAEITKIANEIIANNKEIYNVDNHMALVTQEYDVKENKKDKEVLILKKKKKENN